MDLLQFVSILMEAVVVILGVKLATKKKKSYGQYIALTFGIYVLYDLANLFHFAISFSLLRFLFFIASASILYAVWLLYKGKK